MLVTNILSKHRQLTKRVLELNGALVDLLGSDWPNQSLDVADNYAIAILLDEHSQAEKELEEFENTKFKQDIEEPTTTIDVKSFKIEDMLDAIEKWANRNNPNNEYFPKEGYFNKEVEPTIKIDY